MQRFGHRSEVSFQARSKRSSDANCSRGLVDRQIQQSRRTRDSAEDAQRGGRMPSFIIMVWMHPARDARDSLVTDHVGQKRVSAIEFINVAKG